MSINTKQIKSRIKSVKNTKKITNAMQMIAAVKMRRAVEAAVNTRAYAELALNLLDNVSKEDINHPLAKSRNVNKHVLILITSNRGLCGSYNSNVLKKTAEFVQSHPNETFEVLAIGRKAAKFAKQQSIEVVGLYEKLHEHPQIEEVYPISAMLSEQYKNKEIDKVTLVYTNYISGLVQKVQSRQLLPLTTQSIDEMITDLPEPEKIDKYPNTQISDKPNDYKYEPSKLLILKQIIPMLIDTMMFQAILESAASEHSSRMIAMKNATDAAGDMIDDLTLEYNKGRQAAITQEISEIVGGAAAL